MPYESLALPLSGDMPPAEPQPPAQNETPPAEPETPAENARPAVASDRLEAELLAGPNLPRSIRERLAQSLLPLIQTTDEAEPRVPLTQALTAFASALPASWRLEPPPPEVREHPAGDAFFTGEGPLTEQQASQIARDQLKRHGFLAPT